MFNLIRRHKIASVIMVADIIAILVATLIIVFHQSKTATIDILLAPDSAQITLNGKLYDNFTSYDVTPGDYHAVISMEGMKTKELDFSLENGEFERVWEYLVDENGTFDYYLKNPAQIVTLEQVASDEKAKEFISEFNRITAIRDVLPLEYYDREDPNNQIGIFIEESRNECTDATMCLVVYGGNGHRDRASDLIHEAGFNPDDYKIEFESSEE